jgi:perosamine synthetase
MKTDILEKISIHKPSITELEIEYVNDAIRTGWGDKCYDYIKRFEKSFAAYQGSAFAMSTSSCTGAIHLSLAAMGVGPGDEVIVPDINWIASVVPVTYLGAKPVFVDVLEDSWCIDPAKIEAAITPRTKAILAVHLYGNLAEMEQIMEIARKHGLKVLEDAAEGFGSLYKGRKAGTWGDVGVYSFHGAKTMSTGEGGMLITDSEGLIERIRILGDHGRDPKVNRVFWMAETGYKYKMSNLQAAMGCAQIERADELIEKKREIFSWYQEYLSPVGGLKLNPEPSFTLNSFWMPTVVFDPLLRVRNLELMAYLKEQNIDSRPMFYPLSSLPMFEEVSSNVVSYSLYHRALNLPSHHDLTKVQIERVCNTIIHYLHFVER